MQIDYHHVKYTFTLSPGPSTRKQRRKTRRTVD